MYGVELKIGAERITHISYGGDREDLSSEATLNKIKLLEARQEMGETIRGSKHRLRMLAYACNFTTKCTSQSCTEANTEMILLPVFVKGLADVNTQADVIG